ncbi:DUF4835 family protein [Fluviicola sp.]|jgi:hypothetical protein|uniref:type IX secretion system protein PorD n=1 Tax=Fluviicola sp. TaxID=1917219 RepID=UPI0028395D56|nr:DUF4835 family protein [Fluviicola sp.]MDR0801243.1 DUF4835 family protein [Fluviicola sp.]
MNKILSLLFLALLTKGYSQELNCQVTIVTNIKTEVTSAEKELFDQIKQVITDLMNNTKWTEEKFKVEERINCQLQLQINTINNGDFTGSIQVQSSRPVYNSSYNTTLFNFQDDNLEFSYSRNTVLLYAKNQFRDNLSSILAFYAYYILALDFDSFSLQGGTKYFQEAQQIVSNAQTSSGKGWKSNEQGKKNRYWLVENAMQQLFEPLRECYYEYHRLGMDHLYDKPDVAKQVIYTALDKLSKIASARPNSINIINFAYCKMNELKNLYSLSKPEEKTQIVTVLKKLDPANSSKYEEILN